MDDKQEQELKKSATEDMDVDGKPKNDEKTAMLAIQVHVASGRVGTCVRRPVADC